MVACKTTAKEISLNEWSHYRISSTDSKVDAGIERVKYKSQPL